jgi:hypothetical protein
MLIVSQGKETTMDRRDLLWVGLKLVGATFLILGLGQAGYGLYQVVRLGLKAPESFDFPGEFWRIEAYKTLIQAGVYFISGLALTLGTNLFVWNQRQQRPPEQG